MSIGSPAIVAILANVTLIIFGAALILLVLWQNASQAGNRYFALCMLVLMVFGGVNLLWAIAQRLDLDRPERLLYLATTLYVAVIMLLFNFLIAFSGLPRYIRWIERTISVPLSILFLALLWSGSIFDDCVPLTLRGSLGYRHDITPLGWFGIVVASGYLLSIVALLLAQRGAKARELSTPVILLVMGVVSFSAAQTLRTYSLNAIAILIAVMLLGRLVVKYQVFQPLAELNDELTHKNEQLTQATQLKSQFLANMSHELRTPLNSIIGYAELVLNRTYGDLTLLQDDRLRKVARNGHLLLALINDVLDLSKIEAGRLDLTLSSVDTNALLGTILDSVEDQARSKDLRLIRGYGPLPPLHGDEERLKQILTNLISNAIKFTPQGAVIVRGHANPTRQQVVLTVTDTGIGIPPARQQHVFDTFHQPDGSRPHQHEGTGLGLAIARQLTELHGGSLWFESEVDQGSSFHVALPAAGDVDADPAILEPHARVEGPVVVAMNADFDTLRELQRHLESDTFRVYGAHNGNDGLRLVHALKPTLVLLDLRQFTEDGERVMNVLRHDPCMRHIPLLAIAAADCPMLAALPPDSVLMPPFARSDLVQRAHRRIAAAEPAGARR